MDCKPEAKTCSQVVGLLRLLIFSITRFKSTSCSPLLPVDGMGFGFGEDFLFDPFLHHVPHHDEHLGFHHGPHDYHHHHQYEEWHPFEYSYGVHDPHNHLVGNQPPQSSVVLISLPCLQDYSEHREGDEHGNMVGEYSVALPDGRIQHVR